MTPADPVTTLTLTPADHDEPPYVVPVAAGRALYRAAVHRKIQRMKITTNGNPRALCSFDELPTKVRREFDYVKTSEHHDPRFFLYRRNWHDRNEFVRITRRDDWRGGFDLPVNANSPLLKWDGIQTDSHFSGVLLRYTDDHERVIVGRFFT